MPLIAFKAENLKNVSPVNICRIDKWLNQQDQIKYIAMKQRLWVKNKCFER